MSRIDRLISVIKREIGSILLTKLSHRNVGILSILEVKLSSNLLDAWVYYSQFGDEEACANTKRVLSSATGYIRAELGKALFTQKIPRLHFIYDDRIEKTQELIQKINTLSEDDPQ